MHLLHPPAAERDGVGVDVVYVVGSADGSWLVSQGVRPGPHRPATHRVCINGASPGLGLQHALLSEEHASCGDGLAIRRHLHVPMMDPVRASVQDGYRDGSGAGEPNLRRLPSGSTYAPSTSPWSVSTGGMRRPLTAASLHSPMRECLRPSKTSRATTGLRARASISSAGSRTGRVVTISAVAEVRRSGSTCSMSSGRAAARLPSVRTAL